MTSRSLKLAVATAVSGAALTLAAPVAPIASADAVDNALARIPAGQISCEQAREYWTTEAEYQSIRSQATAVAPFHPRGAEIRAALNRVEEAANRCGLRGTSAGQPSNPAPAPAPAHVVAVAVIPGQPTVDVTVGGTTLRLPDLAAIARGYLSSF